MLAASKRTLASEDMERIMAQLAEDAAYASYEQELSEELQAESDRIRDGNAHKGVHVTEMSVRSLGSFSL